MTEVRQLKLEPMTREAFAPFGDVPEMSGRPPDFEGVGTHAWILDYAEGGTAELLAVNSWYQGLSFSRLERHFDVTQAFVALGPSASGVAVAAPTDPSDPEPIPAPDEVRAFLIEKPMGYILRRGTSHSLDRFPPVSVRGQLRYGHDRRDDSRAQDGRTGELASHAGRRLHRAPRHYVRAGSVSTAWL